MHKPEQLTTQRLYLRQWRPTDLDPFAALNADSQVMAHFLKALSRPESDALAARCQQHIADQGWGIWALETRETGKFIGMTGLSPLTSMPFNEHGDEEGVELVWRLAASAWGCGYATEAARAALEFAFSSPSEVLASPPSEPRSVAVMQRLVWLQHETSTSAR
ncbi:MAG: GNAT family N-acetyltransferase [Pseudohongiellaceae bacterium]